MPVGSKVKLSVSLIAQAYWPYAVIVVSVIVAFLIIRQLSRARRLPYHRRKSLITQSELKFFRVLQSTVGGKFQIFVMVRIADLLQVDKGTNKYRSWLNRIVAKHVDFVICDKESLQPLVAIELDDRSHQRPERQKRDELVDRAFQSANMPLLRFPVEAEYDGKKIRRMIERAV